MNWIPVLWGYAEPFVFLCAAASGAMYWFRVRKARNRRYTNTGSKKFVLALEIGRPVSEAVKAHFGELDCLISVQALLGRAMLETNDDYRKIAREVYRAVAANQNTSIELVLSGPIGLAHLIGQLVGVRKYDITVYQFDPATKGYTALPRADIDML